MRLPLAIVFAGVFVGRLVAQTYSFTTWIGPYEPGYVDGDARTARFDAIAGLAADRHGNVFAADRNYNVVRKITPAGAVSTFAGAAGPRGDLGASVDGVGAQARFAALSGIVIDRDDNLYVSDFGVVRKITPAGVVTTVPGTWAPRYADCIAVDRALNIYVSIDNGVQRITPTGVALVAGAGVPSIRGGYADGVGAAARFDNPRGMVVDASGNIFVADGSNNNIRKVTPGGVVTTFAGSATLTTRDFGFGPSTYPDYGYADGTGTAARLWGPRHIAFDPAGNLIVIEANSVIRKITPAGVVTTVAGSATGVTPGLGVGGYGALSVGPTGDIYVVHNDSIRKGVPVVTPSIQTQPVERTVAPGNPVTFAVDADGGALVYQWRKDGQPITGATSSTYTIASASPIDVGTYAVAVQNSVGSTNSAPVALRLDVNAARLVNLSIRGFVDSGADVLTVGFIVGGAGEKSLLVRGIGPSLVQFDVAGVLANPRLSFFDGSAVVASNDDWGGGDELASLFDSVGAFMLLAGSADAALVRSFGAKGYTVQVNSTTSSAGIALAELYDLDRVGTGPRLQNLSARCTAGAGDETLSAGFAVAGTGSVTLLIRGIGPSLVEFDVENPLADPRLRVRDQNGVIIAENDDWAGAPSLVSAAERTGAFRLGAATKDAALRVMLFAGAYTVEVAGSDSARGTALVEIFELP